MKWDPGFFSITKHTKICSEHFVQNDFVEPEAKKRRLKRMQFPLYFIGQETNQNKMKERSNT